MLEPDPGFDVVGEASIGTEAVALALHEHLDVVLMDLQMPGLDGASATAQIKARYPQTQVLILATYGTDADIMTAIDAGAAVGYLLRPRRAACAGCGRTHVLLPVSVLLRRADEAGVIGAALAQAAAGQGYRPIAERLGRPAATVRGWLRRATARAGPLRSAFTALLCGLDPDPLLPAPAGSPLADAVAAVVAAAGAVARRWGPPASALSPWELASAVTAGALLAPWAAVVLPTRAAPGEPACRSATLRCG